VAVNATETHREIEAVWKIESARVIAGLTRFVRDVGVAEELAQDALVAALEQWPESGVPRNPGAWLMAAAKHRASGPGVGLQLVDRLREDPALRGYHLLPSVRGDLLRKLGRLKEARDEFERAASLTRNARERNLLLARALSCDDRT
jgi:predicted RNA polymerase sigma factor